MGISRKLVQRISSEGRRAALDILNKDGYLTKEQVSEKYQISEAKIYRLIKKNNLPFDTELGAINEKLFVRWKKENEHLLMDRRKDNQFWKMRKEKKK